MKNKKNKKLYEENAKNIDLNKEDNQQLDNNEIDNNENLVNDDNCQVQNDQIANLKEELASWQDRYVRTLADCENAKRRAEIDAKNMIDYKISQFAKDILPLADNISLALASIEGKVDNSVLDGLKSIQDLFISSMEKNGIVKIKTVGEKLNPKEHCVVMQVEDPQFDEGVVAKELQAGYKLGDKVIREAMVVVNNAKK